MRFHFGTTSLLLLGLSACASKKNADYAGHGAESVDPKVLERFAPGPLDGALRARIEKQLDIRSAVPTILSEDGSTLFFNWGVTGVSQVWRTRKASPFPVQMTGGEDPTRVLTITHDGKWLVISRDRKGEENPGLYLLSVDGGPLVEIQHKKGVQTFLQLLSSDGRYLWYSANELKPDSRALYRYDLGTRKAELVFSEPGLWNIDDERGNGDFILSKDIGSQQNEVYLWNSTTKNLVPLLGMNEVERYAVSFAPKAGEYFVHTKKFGDFQRLYLWNGKDFRAVTPERKFEVEGFSIDEKRERLYVSWNEGGLSRAMPYDARTLRELPVPKLPAAIQKDLLHTTWGRTTRNGHYSLYRVETAKAPMLAYIYDWRTKGISTWMLPSTPEIDVSKFVPTTLDHYPARDGTKIPYFVYWPPQCPKPGAAGTPCPVIVDFHGGPEGQSTPYFSPYHQLFVERGFIYMEPNVRGSEGYGKAWLDSDNGPLRLKVITDIEDAAHFVRKAWRVGGAEPKVGVAGGSYGGYSTLYAMTKFAGAYDAGVAVVGMSNLVTFLQNTAPYRRALRISEYGDPVKDREALVELSPVTHVGKIKGPVLIIQGVSDPRVPAGEAIQMYDIMKSRGLDAELILFGDEGHGVTKRPNRVMNIGHTLRFFETHLKK